MKKIAVPLYFACYRCEFKVLAMKKIHKKRTKQEMSAFKKINRHMKKEHPNEIENPKDFEKVTGKKKPFFKFFKK